MVEKSLNEESAEIMMEKFTFMKNAYSRLKFFVKVVPYLDPQGFVFWWYFFRPLVPALWEFHSLFSSLGSTHGRKRTVSPKVKKQSSFPKSQKPWK